MADDTTDTRRKTPTVFGSSSPFKVLQDEVDRIFQAFSAPQTSWKGGLFAGAGAMGLRVDIGESDGEIQVVADLPGMTEDEVEVELAEDVLRIRAERKSEDEKSDKTWQVIERSHGLFEHEIRVPEGIDPDAVQARFEKGVLTVTLPKPPEQPKKTRRIAVEAAG